MGGAHIRRALLWWIGFYSISGCIGIETFLIAQASPQGKGKTANEANTSRLIQALKRGNANGRVGTPDALAEIGPDAKEAVPALITALKESTDLSVRMRIAEALGKIG